MKTELLLYILIAVMVILVIAVLYLALKLYKSSQQSQISHLQNQLDDQYQNDKSLLLKSQETATTLLSLQQQFQTLAQEFHILNKGSFRSYNVLDDISNNLNEIQKVMVNKKARGNWGEFQLEMLLRMYLGDHQNIFQTQYHLSNGAIVDVALHLPGEKRILALDSKFPLENYQNILNQQGNRSMEERYIQLFKTNIKKHIHDISQKYLTSETLETAIMFIPSEAIYTFICGECPELIDEAYKYHVLLTSPTTLAGVVFTLLNITKEFKRTENIQHIEKEISYLLDDMQRLIERTNKTYQYATLTMKHLDEMQTSIQKLAKRMKKINDGTLEPSNKTN